MKSQPWYLYLIECRSGAYYAGITNNLEARYTTHCAGLGAKFTRANPPVRLLGFTPCADRIAAAKAEYVIRQLPRSKKVASLRHRVVGSPARRP